MSGLDVSDWCETICVSGTFGLFSDDGTVFRLCRDHDVSGIAVHCDTIFHAFGCCLHETNCKQLREDHPAAGQRQKLLNYCLKMAVSSLLSTL